MRFSVLNVLQSGGAVLPDTLTTPSVNKFTYLIALASIITALGVRSILSGFAWVVTCRGQAKPYPLHIIGATLVLLLQIEFWWGTFTKRLVTQWRFDFLLAFLLTPILYYFVAELLFPSRAAAQISFRDHYWANFRW